MTITIQRSRKPLSILEKHPRFNFAKLDLADCAGVQELFERHRFPIVIHLAAQAGVRYSLENPYAYVDSNLVGFMNVLEGCRHNECKHLIYASSSSVYGANVKQPFSIHDRVDNPVSLYAATKKANELIGAYLQPSVLLPYDWTALFYSLSTVGTA